MSRIHDALMKAQQDEGISDAPFDPEILLEMESVVPGLPDTFETINQPELSKENTNGNGVQKFRFSSTPSNPDNARLVCLHTTPSQVAEQFRLLRSRLLRERANRHLKTLLVTAVRPGEGKTFVASNLALTLCRQSGSKTLLIDGDLRRSCIHKLFGTTQGPGLSDWLAGAANIQEIIRDTGDGALSITTCGNRASTAIELLQTTRLQQFLSEVQEYFDWIVVDSPPAVVVSDTTVLSQACDGIVFVVSPGTPIETSHKACKELGLNRLIGAVFNRSQTAPRYYDYYSYQQHK